MKQLTLFQPGQLQAQFADTAHSGASYQRKELAQWMPTLEPADAELLPELGTLVARSRDLARNHGIASSAFQTQLDNVLGSRGLRLAATPDYRALNRDIAWAEAWSHKVETLWRGYAESFTIDAAERLNFNFMTAMVFRSVLMSGEILVLPLWLDDRNATYSTAFQLVEGDRLSNPYGKPDTDNMRGGIEIDKFGKARAYHIRKVEVSDWMVPGFYSLWGKWERIPAETPWGRKRVLHLYLPER